MTQYSFDTTERCHERNIEMLTSDDPTLRSTARLNQVLINVFDEWFQGELAQQVRLYDVAMASLQGIYSLFGTIAMEYPDLDRAAMLEDVRTALNEGLDGLKREIEGISKDEHI